MMTGAVHVVWCSTAPGQPPAWVIVYEDGRFSNLKSQIRDGVIGWAVSLGRPVVVHKESGDIDFVIPAEKRSRFNFTFLSVVASFLVLIAFAIMVVIGLAKILFR